MIHQLRYFLGVANLLVLPPGLLFWFVIHPWAHWWRKLGATRTYLIVLPVLIAPGMLMFHFRASLLGADLGPPWYGMPVAMVLYGVTTWLEVQYWRHLSIPTLVGVPELSTAEQHQGKLLQDGIYRVVRHPRYLSAGLAVIGNALLINYSGMYLLILFLFPLGYLMVLLEERELVRRFGDAYRRYQREVPRLLPRARRPTQVSVVRK